MLPKAVYNVSGIDFYPLNFENSAIYNSIGRVQCKREAGVGSLASGHGKSSGQCGNIASGSYLQIVLVGSCLAKR